MPVLVFLRRSVAAIQPVKHRISKNTAADSFRPMLPEMPVNHSVAKPAAAERMKQDLNPSFPSVLELLLELLPVQLEGASALLLEDALLLFFEVDAEATEELPERLRIDVAPEVPDVDVRQGEHVGVGARSRVELPVVDEVAVVRGVVLRVHSVGDAGGEGRGPMRRLEARRAAVRLRLGSQTTRWRAQPHRRRRAEALSLRVDSSCSSRKGGGGSTRRKIVSRVGLRRLVLVLVEGGLRVVGRAEIVIEISKS